jgi:hypothetical protein
MHPSPLLVLALLISIGACGADRDVSAQRPTPDRPTDRVVGSIQDRFGQLIQGAKIVFQAKVDGKKLKQETTSDQDGAFDIWLRPGTYDVSVTFPGFHRYRNRKVIVTAAGPNTMNIVLEIDPKKSVTVNARNRD